MKLEEGKEIPQNEMNNRRIFHDVTHDTFQRFNYFQYTDERMSGTKPCSRPWGK